MRVAVRGVLALSLAVLPGCVDTDSFRCDLALVGSAPGCPVVTRPACTGFSWIAEPVRCQDTFLPSASCAGIGDLMLDPGASPPQARMRVGEAVLVQLSAVNPVPPDGSCSFNPGGLFSWVSSEPGIARVESTSINTLVVVRAVAPGDADVHADGVNTPGGTVRAPLAVCVEGRAGAACIPGPLVLRVVR